MSQQMHHTERRISINCSSSWADYLQWCCIKLVAEGTVRKEDSDFRQERTEVAKHEKVSMSKCIKYSSSISKLAEYVTLGLCNSY